MNLLIRLLFLFPVFGILTSCMEPPATPARLPTISFESMQPITLDVAEVTIVDNYQSPMRAPNVEHQMYISPMDGISAWVRDRLRTTGTRRLLEVSVKDASVKEVPLQRTQGMKGVLKNDNAFRYDARVEVEMRIYGESAISEANINAVATRSLTLSESASPNDRDQMYNALTKGLMSLLNAELEKNFHQYFSNYIVYTPGTL